ncbi:MAG: ATPase [Chloroflexi bacterium]|nr:ATPase [Chloroflexota bacterium]
MIYSNKPFSPRIESLTVKNYRVLQNVQFKDLTPLAVFIGPNGSGKSTVLDVFAFLSENMREGLRPAWDRRGRFKEMRSRGATGPITIQLKYREALGQPVITYQLEIDEDQQGPFVSSEWLQWRPGTAGKPVRFLEFARGAGYVIAGEKPSSADQGATERFDARDTVAVSVLGRLAAYPRIGVLRRFITAWYLSHISTGELRTVPETKSQERLSVTGDNLPNVIQHFQEQYPQQWDQILQILKLRVPQLTNVILDQLAPGRLLLQIKDAPFAEPIPVQFVSEGLLQLLAHLILLCNPEAPPLIGIEEPENHIAQHLLAELAEIYRSATRRTQLLITTHSPFFVNGLAPEEVWALSRNSQGYTQARRAAEMLGIKESMAEGAQLGYLWTEGHFQNGTTTLKPGNTENLSR